MRGIRALRDDDDAILLLQRVVAVDTLLAGCYFSRCRHFLRHAAADYAAAAPRRRHMLTRRCRYAACRHAAIFSVFRTSVTHMPPLAARLRHAITLRY